MSNPELIKNFTAGGAIAAYRLVRLSAADTVVQAAAATEPLIGATMDVAPVSGERTDVVINGIALVEAGGAVALTNLVTSDATGRAVAAAPATGVNNRIIGVPLEAAVAAGDIIRVLLSPGSLQG
ncbi:hypothetical protein [Falsiroseomonas sp.]|uniref:hypothetical protein n=1 Tax=Falsiroseomonas sp. TaxID=2870721 RepID=UPI003F7312BF